MKDLINNWLKQKGALPKKGGRKPLYADLEIAFQLTYKILFNPSLLDLAKFSEEFFSNKITKQNIQKRFESFGLTNSSRTEEINKILSAQSNSQEIVEPGTFLALVLKAGENNSAGGQCYSVIAVEQNCFAGHVNTLEDLESQSLRELIQTIEFDLNINVQRLILIATENVSADCDPVILHASPKELSFFFKSGREHNLSDLLYPKGEKPDYSLVSELCEAFKELTSDGVCPDIFPYGKFLISKNELRSIYFRKHSNWKCDLKEKHFREKEAINQVKIAPNHITLPLLLLGHDITAIEQIVNPEHPINNSMVNWGCDLNLMFH